jgi:hypothetical protein
MNLCNLEFWLSNPCNIVLNLGSNPIVITMNYFVIIIGFIKKRSSNWVENPPSLKIGITFRSLCKKEMGCCKAQWFLFGLSNGRIDCESTKKKENYFKKRFVILQHLRGCKYREYCSVLRDYLLSNVICVISVN